MDYDLLIRMAGSSTARDCRPMSPIRHQRRQDCRMGRFKGSAARTIDATGSSLRPVLSITTRIWTRSFFGTRTARPSRSTA